MPCDPQPHGPGNAPGELQIRLLGPFAVSVAGAPVRIGSPKQRAVLALLALSAGTVVPSYAISDLIWTQAQPASPSATLQSLISRLRAALADARHADGRQEVLQTRDPGWVLDVAPEAVDALRFHELIGRARRRRGRGEDDAASADLTEALALWRGAALAGVVEAGYLAAQATRLNEARLDAVEDSAEAELAVGRAAAAQGLLEGHVDANPLRERAWGLLMVALYRLGRQAAALRAFQQVRTVLAEELGLDPSPGLAELEQRILRHDPTLGWASPVAISTSQDPVPGRGTPRPRPASPAQAAGITAGGHVVDAAPGAPAPAGEFADYTVVVVEDHDFQRRTVVQLLRSLGVGTVVDAPGGGEALRLLQSSAAPDVIICDIDMPGMDGVEFVTRVAESNLACALVIASGLETSVLRAVEAIGENNGVHVLAALEKPLTARRLGDVLRQYTRPSREGPGAPESIALTGDELRQALDGGALRTYFGARIGLTTGTFSSVEAHGRRHPEGSAIRLPPIGAGNGEGARLVFVERLVADSCALLDQIGRAGLDTGTAFRVVINLSHLPLANAGLADSLAAMVAERRQAPRRFVWEVDDISLARAPAAALQVLTRLRVRGFGLALSHSGAGPSWSALVDRAPLTELKLDRRLVTAASGEPKRFGILEATLSAAQDSGYPVVADGCDSRADFDMLLALGCSEAQGRFLSDPLEGGDLLAWARSGSARVAPESPR